jgi:hypothetical protein
MWLWYEIRQAKSDVIRQLCMHNPMHGKPHFMLKKHVHCSNVKLVRVLEESKEAPSVDTQRNGVKILSIHETTKTPMCSQ